MAMIKKMNLLIDGKEEKRPLTKIREIYSFRNMIRAQVTRTLFGKYRNSFFGFIWNFVNPVIYLILCYVMFVQLGSPEKTDYWIFLGSGVFTYNMLMNSITGGTTTFTSNAGMIKKMYFPREIIPISNAISSLVVLIIGFVVLLFGGIIVGYHFSLLALSMLPFFIILILMFYVGSCLLLGSLTVYVRDIQYLVSSFNLIFFICTPLRSMLADVNGPLKTIMMFNPLTYFIEPIHEIMYYGTIPTFSSVLTTSMISVVTIMVGYATFLKLKKGFVEKL